MIPVAPVVDTGNCSGFCRSCNSYHRLPSQSAAKEAQRLIKMLERKRSIDLLEECTRSRLDVSTASLFGPQRGKMFGILECVDSASKPLWLYGFSGQYNGHWLISGWVPPLFDVEEFKRVHDPVEREIKNLSRQIEQHTDPHRKNMLQNQRTELSRRLMKRIHKLYRINNFRGRSATLDQVLGSTRNKPTGIGDCCAPKLLNEAARLNLAPVSLAEFYFGRKNRSDTREHRHFYPPCEEKCRPLLGFLLCGAAAQ